MQKFCIDAMISGDIYFQAGRWCTFSEKSALNRIFIFLPN